MIYLVKLFENLFDDRAINSERLKIFAEDMVDRLTDANPANVYDAIIAETETKIDALDVIITGKMGEISGRQGSVIDKNTARHNFIAFLSRKEGLIKSVFGKPSSGYEAFFPQGLTAYHNASDAEFKNMADTAVAKAVLFVADLGVPFKDSLTTLRNTYRDAKDTLGTDKGEVEVISTEEVTTKTALEIQLTKNVHFIAYNNPGNGLVAYTYTNESLLFAQHRTKRHKGLLEPNGSKIITPIAYAAGKHIKAKNNGASPWTIQMKLGQTFVGTIFTLNPGDSIDKAFSEFFSNADGIVIHNTSGLEGMYIVSEIA